MIYFRQLMPPRGYAFHYAMIRFADCLPLPAAAVSRAAPPPPRHATATFIYAAHDY